MPGVRVGVVEALVQRSRRVSALAAQRPRDDGHRPDHRSFHSRPTIAAVLTKDLLRVSRAGGGYHPQFVDADDRELAARVLGVVQGHVGHSKGDLEDALEDVERAAEEFKLVRGFAKLLERDLTVETRAPVEPARARRAAFRAAAEVGVVSPAERREALALAAERLGVDGPDDADDPVAAVERSLFADLPERQRVVAVDSRWDPDELLAQYNLSLAQTALFDAVEVRVRSADPKGLVSAVKRLGLMYEVHAIAPDDAAGGTDARGDDEDAREGRTAGDPWRREVVVTGPTALFRRSRRYGTRFARLLWTLAGVDRWELVATVDDRGTERELRLSEADPVRPPGVEPVATVEYDSDVEADFAARFEALDLDWTLVREPDLLAAGEGAMVPDFAFDYDHADFRVYFEIVGFWTPEYVAKKLDQLAAAEEGLVVAVDESLGVGEAVAARDHRVVEYTDRVPLKAVRRVLRTYEDDLVTAAAAGLPEDLRPDDDVLALAALADRYGVPEAALEDRSFPEHRLVGRTLVRPAVLAAVDDRVEPGQSLSTVEETLAEYGLGDASAVLAALDYRVEWTGLSGGTVRER
jgi:predicted nuclease of restriction endonuclease-like RecB superfamily